MTKKLLVILTLFIITLFACTYVFANNDMNQAGENIKNAVQGTGNAVRNGIQNLENGIENGARNTGNAIKNGTEHVENGIENTTENMTDTATGTSNNGGYTTARLATDGTAMDNAWTWIIVAAVAIIAIALIWYFVTRNNDNH